jgi:ketosteroid isomerase-like protein
MEFADQNISFGSLPRGEGPMQFATQYDNREVLRGYFKGLLEQWTMNFYEVKQFIAQGDMVVMQGFCSWTNKATGKTVETPKVDIWRFRDGKAVEFYELSDARQVVPRTPIDLSRSSCVEGWRILGVMQWRK